MKKRILCLLIGVTMLFSVGCGKKEEEIDPIAQDTIDKIETLGDITLDDEDMIVKLEKTYSEMTEKQKNQVKNYIDLKNAREELDELKEQEEAEKEAEKDASFEAIRPYYPNVSKMIKKLKSQLSNPSSLDIKTIVYITHENTTEADMIAVAYVAQNSFGAEIDELARYMVASDSISFDEKYDDFEIQIVTGDNEKYSYTSTDGVMYKQTDGSAIMFMIDLDDYQEQGNSLK